MTIVGFAGIIITGWQASRRYARGYRKLSSQLQSRVDSKLDDPQRSPCPPGPGFEELSGYSNPDVYTVHITGNYKLSFELNGSIAFLRRVAPHDEMDRAP